MIQVFDHDWRVNYWTFFAFCIYEPLIRFRTRISFRELAYGTVLDS